MIHIRASVREQRVRLQSPIILVLSLIVTGFICVWPRTWSWIHEIAFLDSSPNNEHNTKRQQELPGTLVSHPRVAPTYDKIIERIDSWTTEITAVESSRSFSKVLQVVSHRELLIGCYSFQEYLSPQFHTLIVLPREFAYAMQLDQMVTSATPETTAGVHLFLTEDWAGSHLARKVGEEFARHELEPNGWQINYLNSINCDVHQLPSDHTRFAPMEQLTLQLERDFDIAKKLRQQEGRAIETNYDDRGYPSQDGNCTHACNLGIPPSDMELLAMNTILFEDIPDSQSFRRFHGRDTGDWWRQGGWANKPQELIDAGLPWLRDESGFFEDHQIMFDLQALRKIKDIYWRISPETFPDENNFLGLFANANNFTVVRNNDIVFHLNFGHNDAQLDYPEAVDLEQLKLWNFELLGRYRSPRFLSGNWERAASLAGIVSDHRPFTLFVFWHCRKKTWLPDSWTSRSHVADPVVLAVVDSYFQYCGYHRRPFDNDNPDDNKVLRYELDGVHPPTRLVHYKKRGKRFLTLQDHGKDLKLYLDGYKWDPPNNNTGSSFSSFLEISRDAMLGRENLLACKG